MPALPPRLLQIHREAVKVGSEAAYDAIETTPRASAQRSAAHTRTWL